MFINLYKQIIHPKSKNRDKARIEYILNILLLGLIILAFAAFLVTIIHSFIYGPFYKGENPLIMSSVVIFLLFLLLLSRKGKSEVSALIFVCLIFTLTLYTSYRWGADSPQALLMYSLIIVIAGILLGSFYAFLLTLISGLTILLLASLEIRGIHHPDYSWKYRTVRMGGAIVFTVTLAITAIVSWLFNREMERTLKRARASEQALKRQRDKLEVAVEKRTKQLKQVQAEKMQQMYKFAQFGKSASGLFHNLLSPLTLVSLNLNMLDKSNKLSKTSFGKKELSNTQLTLKRAVLGTRRLESYLLAARKQIQNQEIRKSFSLNEELDQILQVLEHRAKENKIQINVSAPPIRITGNPLKFNQLMTNLISNTLDAYDNSKKKSRTVEINLQRVDGQIRIEVKDFGVGIASKDLSKVFEPLYTTKGLNKGTGIGLSICKDIVEKDFKGQIQAESRKGVGSTFKVAFPIRHG